MASYGFPTMCEASTVRFGDKVFPETADGQALPSGIVANIIDHGKFLLFVLDDGRAFQLSPYDGLFCASRQ